MSKKKIVGSCRICGKDGPLTEEHYIPKAAGGGAKITMYSGNELLKSLNDDPADLPRGKIKQSGLSSYSLCKQCNDLSGYSYDNDFAYLYNGINSQIPNLIKIPNGTNILSFLENRTVSMELIDIKPMNIAKRILVSFCSVEHPGLTNRLPEIRQAILEQDYKPNAEGFSIYLSLHLGHSAFYGTVAAMKTLDDHIKIEAFAGIESELIAFYFTSHGDTKANGLEHCIDITHWLTDYEFNEQVNMPIELTFIKSRSIKFPLPN